jgi:hypothetical protein
VFTTTSNRAVGLLREIGGNDESAIVTGDRDGRRVRPGRRRLRVAAETGTCCIVRRARGNPQPTSGTARRPGRVVAFGHTSVCTWVSSRQRGRGKEPKELGPPQLDSARSVPGARTEGSGNRVSVKRCHGVEAGKPVSSPKRGIARHAARRDGRCEQVEEKANAQQSTSGGPVHPSGPGRRAGESPQRRPGRFRFRPDTRTSFEKCADLRAQRDVRGIFRVCAGVSADAALWYNGTHTTVAIIRGGPW